MAPGIALNLALIVALAGWLAWRAASPSKALRFRNALRADTGDTLDFDWPPERPPRQYRVERAPADPFFVDVVRTIGADGIASEWERALAIARHLVENARDTGPVRADLRRTYEAIREGHGYCADYVRVFMALAHAAGVPARQWGFSFDGFGGHGHTVVEIYDRTRRKWLVLDVYNNFHVVDSASGEPLGALEYRDALMGRRAAATRVANGPGRPGFVHDATALDYYRRGIDQWYLLWGNDVVSRDHDRIVRAVAHVSRPLARGVAHVIGGQPRIRVYANADNVAEVRRLLALRREAVAAACVGALLIAALAVQLASASAAAKAGG